MNANLDLERRLSDYYASEAPPRAPDRVLAGTLAAIDSSTQRRVLIRAPWRFPTMNSYAKFAIAAVAVIALGALGVTVFRGGAPPGPDVGVPSSASPGPSASSPAALAGIPGTATVFVQPFDFVLPREPEFVFGARTGRYFEIRVPQWADGGHPGGLIVQSVRGGRTDQCDGESASLELKPGPQGIFEYLATIPELTVTDVTATTVDGRPARQATVRATETADCPELHVWAEEGEPFITGTDLRLIAFEVDGEPIVVTIYGESGNPQWPAMADEFLASLRFQP
jgi:hypothetical protein